LPGFPPAVTILPVDTFTYQQALDYLYSFIDYSLQRTYRYSDHTFDLGRMHDFLRRLGNPHRKYAVIHVAGTKGKGSTAAMIDSVLRAVPCRTGFYTSPHLVDFTERIRFGGVQIAPERLAELVGSMRATVKKVPGLTTFEITTGAAFLYFAQEKADAVIAEVGLGGRLDATNVVVPLAAVITSISYDHTHLLGNTLAEITREKAGIIKRGIPVISSPQEGEPMKVLLQVTAERNAPLTLVGKDWHFAPQNRDLERQTFLLWSSADQARMDAVLSRGGDPEWVPERFEIPLLGYHQVVNAATAFAALRVVRGLGWNIPDAAIHEGFRTVRWDGRFQILNRSPFVVVDSAHNRDSARRLRIALEDYFPSRRIVMLFGASDDKDIAGMFDELLPRVARVVATRSKHPRAAQPEAVAALARERGCPADPAGDPAAALGFALGQTGPEDLLLVAGSLFVAGAVLEEWPKLRMGTSRIPREEPAAGDRIPKDSGIDERSKLS
jgi:dihydrofolate synthase/folylpolyglutamate synthase